MGDVTPSSPRSAKPTIAVFSGATATIANSAPLVISNKAWEHYGLPLRANPDGSPMRWDVVWPQRLIVRKENPEASPIHRPPVDVAPVAVRSDPESVRLGPCR